MKYPGYFILLFVFTLFTGIYAADNSANDIDGRFTVDGITREYILHLPKNYGSESLPLVMVFHGGGGTADQIKDHTKFNKLADKENFNNI